MSRYASVPTIVSSAPVMRGRWGLQNFTVIDGAEALTSTGFDCEPSRHAGLSLLVHAMSETV